MTIKRRGIAAALCLSLALTMGAAVPGCKKAGDSGEQVNITFMGWGYEQEKAVFTQMIQDFEADHPNVKVKYIIAPSSEYDTKLSSMMSAGTQPDVFFMDPKNLMVWADGEKILNLDDYVKNSQDFDTDNIWESAINRYRYDGTKVGQGSLWALPKDVGPWSMVYNKDIFAARGVTPPTREDPWTWDEYLENVQKLTYTDENGRKVYGAGYFMLETAVWSNGADFLDATNTKVTVDTPEFAEAMQWVADLRLKHQVMPSVEEESSIGAYARWMSGTCATFAMGPWDQAAFWELGFDWDLMPWPVSPRTGKAVPYLGSAGFAVSADSAHKQEAFDLAAYFSVNRQGQTTNYQMGQAVPNLIDMANNEYKTMDKAPASKDIFFDIIETGRGYSRELTYNSEWIDEFWLDANKVWSGTMTAAEYVKEIQPRMQSLLDNALAIKAENAK